MTVINPVPGKNRLKGTRGLGRDSESQKRTGKTRIDDSDQREMTLREREREDSDDADDSDGSDITSEAGPGVLANCPGKPSQCTHARTGMTRMTRIIRVILCYMRLASRTGASRTVNMEPQQA